MKNNSYLIQNNKGLDTFNFKAKNNMLKLMRKKVKI